MQLPIGHSDYAEIASHKGINGDKFCMVDKTCFIRDVVNDNNKVIIITRPRRFGKTLNLSMLHYFFDHKYNSTATDDLFANTIIFNDDATMQFKGQYPSIFLTLGDIKSLTFDSMINQFKIIMSRVYIEYSDILSSDKLTTDEKSFIKTIASTQATADELCYSLSNLTSYIHKVTGRKAIICLDEYDTPIQASYLHMYYEKCINFILTFFSRAFKNNSHLEKAILTGITRVSKESLFSGMNHARVYTILDKKYSEYFGFSIDEIRDLYMALGYSSNLDSIRQWYNGYNFGGNVIYNPWSVVNCADNDMQYKAYWVNTADNSIIKTLIMQSDYHIKETVEKLINDNTIDLVISDHFTYADKDSSANQILNLLLTAGYLTAVSTQDHPGMTIVKAKIPNLEVKYVYLNVIQDWFREKTNIMWYIDFAKYLTTADTEKLTVLIKKYMHCALSFFNTAKDGYENFYHGMTLGFVAGLSETHIIKSNREARFGRYDICIIPKDKSKLGIVIELKNTNENQDLNSLAATALDQAIDKNYSQELQNYDIANYLLLGIGYSKKDLAITSKLCQTEHSYAT